MPPRFLGSNPSFATLTVTSGTSLSVLILGREQGGLSQSPSHVPGVRTVRVSLQPQTQAGSTSARRTPGKPHYVEPRTPGPRLHLSRAGRWNHSGWRRPSKVGPSAGTIADRQCKLGASPKSKVTISQNFEARTPNQTNHLLGIYLHMQVSWDSLPLALSALMRILFCAL